MEFLASNPKTVFIGQAVAFPGTAMSNTLKEILLINLRKYLIVKNENINDKKVAISISNDLVKMKFSPCVQVIPNLISTYTFDEKVYNDTEYLILIKTS